MKKITLYIIVFLCAAITAGAQATGNVPLAKMEITGTVTDTQGEPLIGVSVVVKNKAGLGTATGVDGSYRITVEQYNTLVFSYLGFETQEFLIKDVTRIDVVMKESVSTVLDEVVITATGTQKKATLTGAITTVDLKTIKVPTANITNALAGNVAGIISMQTSGEPGSNASEFWIRGISTFGAGASALVLVDGFERPFNELNVEDIESFSVLKDASATAIYGARGANGVLLVTTKKGNSGKININVKAEYGYGMRTRTPEFVDGYTYAGLVNEARLTRNQEPVYTPAELEIIKYNLDPDVYPNVDWMDVLLRDGTNIYRASVNLDGGGPTARYFVSASFLDEGGIYKTDETLKDYNTNANLQRWNYRSNVDIDITPTTVLRTGVSGFLEKQNKAGVQGQIEWLNPTINHIWSSLVATTPVAVPVMYSNGRIPAMGGTTAGRRYSNPWTMATQTGYSEYWRSKVETNVTLEQDFKFITEGLRFVGRFAFDSDSKNSIFHIKFPEEWQTGRRRNVDGSLTWRRYSTEIQMTQSADSWSERVFNLEGELHYARGFADIHNITAMVKYAQRERKETLNTGTDMVRGVPHRNQSLAGRFTYDLFGRYFVEFNGGYSGSEVFKTGHQFGFFPAISGGWNISEEPWLKPHTPWLDLFKVRYSYGKVGNEKIQLPDGTEIRFPYVETISGTDGGAGYQFADYGDAYWFDGRHYTAVASDVLTWEVSTKHNLGFDIHLFGDKFSGTIDIYRDVRSSIYMQRQHLPEMAGLTNQPWANVGKMENRGFDGQFNAMHRLGDVEFTLRGNITYTHNKVIEYDEEANALPYKMTQGYRWQQAKGLIALGLFKDYDDIRNSPRQTYGEYMPGDIKYKDVNGDGLIDDNDIVAVGASRVPSLIYGMGLSVMWKGFDFNIHFQGAGKSAYFLNGFGVYPFVEGGIGNILSLVGDPNNRWISREISGTPDTERTDAMFPRLSYSQIEWLAAGDAYVGGTQSPGIGHRNNYRASTFWLRDGAYLRLKTLEIGYTIPKAITNKAHMNTVRLYFIGTNLLLWDSLKVWDPELASGHGMNYPLAKTLTFGLTINM
ncbi:MAG: TonB-dependent receptor [Prevotellaceae bacterium]|jgi:TonB-linked SusC/RagA family outer membrane protein|nr:TonB-dependent receptor [Prevotellaceae bacterium]